MSNNKEQLEAHANALLKQMGANVPVVGDRTAEILKGEFCKAQGHSPIELSGEEQKAQHGGLLMATFEDGDLIKYHALPNKPGYFALLVRSFETPEKSEIKHVGTVNNQHVAQMIVDGVNFLMKCKEEQSKIELEDKANALKAQLEQMKEVSAGDKSAQLQERLSTLQAGDVDKIVEINPKGEVK